MKIIFKTGKLALRLILVFLFSSFTNVEAGIINGHGDEKIKLRKEIQGNLDAKGVENRVLNFHDRSNAVTRNMKNLWQSAEGSFKGMQAAYYKYNEIRTNFVYVSNFEKADVHLNHNRIQNLLELNADSKFSTLGHDTELTLLIGNKRSHKKQTENDFYSLNFYGDVFNVTIYDYFISLISSNSFVSNTVGSVGASDLSVSKTDGSSTYTLGTNVTYTIVATNNGPDVVTGASVTDAVPTGIPSTNVSYTAVASAGSTTTVVGTQTGAISDTVDLPVGGTVTYTVVVSVPSSYTGDLVNTVSIANPAGNSDPNPGNNSATDTDTLSIYNCIDPQGLDSDGDGIDDKCDLDDDNDGILDDAEGCRATPFLGDDFGGATGVYLSYPNTSSTGSGSTLTTAVSKSNVKGFIDVTDPTVISPLSLGAGINASWNFNPGPPAGGNLSLTGINSTSISDADSNGDYLQFSFKTLDANFLSYLDWFSFWNGSSSNPSFTVSVVVSNDGFISNSTIIGTRSQIGGEGSNSYPIAIRASDNSNYYLDRNTTYTFRIYFYNVSGGSTSTVLFDDFLIAFYKCTIDTDGDNILDYLDLDSDNDGCPDAIEGSSSFKTTNLQTASGSLQGGNGTSPLILPTSGTYNQEVVVNLGIAVSTDSATYGVPTLAGAGQGIGESQNASVVVCCDVSQSGYPDLDGDNVADDCDLDNDNDGILDSVECNSTWLNWSVENVETVPNSGIFETQVKGVFNGTVVTFESNHDFPTVSTGNFYEGVNGLSKEGANYQDQSVLNISNAPSGTTITNYTFANPTTSDYYLHMYAVEGNYQINNTEIISVKNGTGVGTNTFTFVDQAGINDEGGFTAKIPSGTTSFNIVTQDVDTDYFMGISTSCEDYDGDGLPNYLDLDSDNDGCPDAIEGGDEVQSSDLVTAAGNLLGGNGVDPSVTPYLGRHNKEVLLNIANTPTQVDAQGVPIIVNGGESADVDTLQGQGLGSSLDITTSVCCDAVFYDLPDIDGDKISDNCDLDNDNDGILNTTENICPNDYIEITNTDVGVAPSSSAVSFTNADISSKFGLNPGAVLVSMDVVSTKPNGRFMVGTPTSSWTNVTISGTSPVFIQINHGGSLKDVGEQKLIISKDGSPYKITYDVDGDTDLPGAYRGEYQGKYFVEALDNIITNVGQNIIYRALTTGTKVQVGTTNDPPSTPVNSNFRLYLKLDCDLDGDGLPNYLDLDTDNDGCPDVIEGSASLTATDLVTASGTLQGGNGSNPVVTPIVGTHNQAVLDNLGTAVSTATATIGVPTKAGAGQALGSSQDTNVSACFCYNLPNTTGTPETTKHGVTLLKRAGGHDVADATSNADWPLLRRGAFTAVESNTKGFVVTRMTTIEIEGQTTPTVIASKIANPIDGMMIYDTTAKCLKIYTVDESSTANPKAGQWKCYTTPSCP